MRGRGEGAAVAFQRDYLSLFTPSAACDAHREATPGRQGRDYFLPQSGGGGSTKAAAAPLPGERGRGSGGFLRATGSFLPPQAFPARSPGEAGWRL